MVLLFVCRIEASSFKCFKEIVVVESMSSLDHFIIKIYFQSALNLLFDKARQSDRIQILAFSKP